MKHCKGRKPAGTSRSLPRRLTEDEHVSVSVDRCFAGNVIFGVENLPGECLDDVWQYHPHTLDAGVSTDEFPVIWKENSRLSSRQGSTEVIQNGVTQLEELEHE